jgi:hypothetical protein
MFLGFAARLELAFGNPQRMVAAFNDMQEVWCFHLGANLLKKIPGTKRIARALDKEDRRAQSPQNFSADFRAIAQGTEWVSEANKPRHFFLQRYVTTNATTHAFADQDCRSRCVLFSRFAQCFSMRSDQARQRIGSSSAFLHVVIIESLDVSYLTQEAFPILHPGMRCGRARTGSEEKESGTLIPGEQSRAISLLRASRLGFRRKICERHRRGAEYNRATPDGSAHSLHASRNRDN